MKRACITAALATLVGATAMGGTPVPADGPGHAKDRANRVYVVQMNADPVVAYKGNIRGYQATKPSKGQKIDPTDPHVINYVGYLDARHDDALAAVGGGRKLYDYRFTYNGFAAELTEEQAAAIARAPGVLAVSRDELNYAVHLIHSDLPGPGRSWRTVGPTGRRGECRRRHHHRRCRLRHLAGEPELL